MRRAGKRAEIDQAKGKCYRVARPQIRCAQSQSLFLAKIRLADDAREDAANVCIDKRLALPAYGVQPRGRRVGAYSPNVNERGEVG
jgi:hypothetical protein